MTTTADRRVSPARLIMDLANDPDLGLAVHHACGIAANAYEESALILGRQEGTKVTDAVYPIKYPHGGIDLLQWTADRRFPRPGKAKGLSFYEFVTSRKLPYPAYETSLAFLKFELLGPEKKSLAMVKRTKTARAAAETFEHWNERSRDGRKNWKKRGDTAERFYALYHNAAQTPAPAPAPIPATPETTPVNTSMIPEGYFKSPAFWGLVGSVSLKVAALAGATVSPALGAVIGEVGPVAASLIGDAVSGVGHVMLAKKAKAQGAAEAPLPEVLDAEPEPAPAPMSLKDHIESASIAEAGEALESFIARIDSFASLVARFRHNAEPQKQLPAPAAA